MRILISGSSGFVGGALTRKLRSDGHDVLPLRRDPNGPDPYWIPDRGLIEAKGLEGFDAVIHLAGESLAGGRWTSRRKRRFRESRVPATRLLAETLAGLESPPKLFISASAVGIYGSRGDERLEESAAVGRGFLADLSRHWEAATTPAEQAGIRVVNLRIGMVLGSQGGALTRLEPIFRAGLGGRLGSGNQWMSWISLGDLLNIMVFLLDQVDLAGPVNAVAPEPVRNIDFTNELARSLGRLAILHVPAFVLRIVLGEMADEMLLGSQRVEARRLLDAGFRFEHPSLAAALEHLYRERNGDP